MLPHELQCRFNEQGETEFSDVECLEAFAQACETAERERILKGRIIIDAFRYVFLPFAKLRGRPLMKLVVGRDPDSLNPRLMTKHFTGMLNRLMSGRKLPENICSELLENHFESPLRIWCEKLIVFNRIVKLESAIDRVLAKIGRTLRKQKGFWYLLALFLLWPRWLLNKVNLVMLKFQIDLAVLLIGIFVRRRRNLVELAWEIDNSRLILEVCNNARIPESLANVAAKRVSLARVAAAQPMQLGKVGQGINREIRPLTEHLLSGSGLGIIMVASAAMRYGGTLAPPRYDPRSGKTVAVFTAELDRLPASPVQSGR